jgi:uncharacterized protein YjbI with pentapeptide repeats
VKYLLGVFDKLLQAKNMRLTTGTKRILLPWRETGRFVRVNKVKGHLYPTKSFALNQTTVEDSLQVDHMPSLFYETPPQTGPGPYRAGVEVNAPIIELESRVLHLNSLRAYLNGSLWGMSSENIQILREAGFRLRRGEEYTPENIFQAFVGRLTGEKAEIFENKYGDLWDNVFSFLSVLQTGAKRRRMWYWGEIRLDLSGLVFADMDLCEVNFSNANINRADLRGVDFTKADLSRTSLIRANLEAAKLRGVSFQSADLREANLQRANLIYAGLQHADFSGADLRGSKINSANLVETDFKGADLREADLRGLYAISPKFDGADLRGAKVWSVDIKRDPFLRARESILHVM